jgi:hypothetical protein
MYYMKNNSEKKWCLCKEPQPTQQKNFIYAPMDKPKIPVYAPVNIKFTEAHPNHRRRVLVPSSQLIAPDTTVNVPQLSVERYTGFVPYNARAVAATRSDPTPLRETMSFDFGNAIFQPPPQPAEVSNEQYDAALLAFYSTLNMPVPSSENYDDAPAPRKGSIPIEATAYASLPAEYAENFTPLQVNRYGAVSKWR